MTTDTSPILTPLQVAYRLGQGWSRDAAAHLMETGQLRAVNKGTAGYHHWRTSEAWLAEFLAGRGQTVGNAPPGGSGPVRPSPVRGLEYAGPKRT